jgi:hypothetical protein
MARPARPERSRSARSSRQLSRFYHSINPDRVFGTQWHGRRQVIWFGVTTHPTAEWIANQLTEACGWEQLPRYLIRDCDAAYGEVFIRRVRSMGIRDQPTSPRSRFDPAGMPRPRCRVRRMPPPPPAAVVHDILQWRPHTSLLGEGCAVLAYRRTGRADSLPPNSRRAAPQICPDLIFDRHRRLRPHRTQITGRSPGGSNKVPSEPLVPICSIGQGRF